MVNHFAATLVAVRLFDLLPEHPMVTLSGAMELLKTSKPTAAKTIEGLRRLGVINEITGKRRDRVYAYEKHLKVLSEDTTIPRG